jgi:DNA repair exonuclease SbcCD nuclease subunit
MARFQFLHAADLHLDSPLIGLSCKSADFAKKVELASRQAFDNLVRMAIEEKCRFVVLSGDVFDRDQRHYPTGLHFVQGMKRLGDEGIDVFVVLGNHDAGNRFADKLGYAGKVHVFDRKRAGTKMIDEVGVAVHGRSFPKWDTDENLALGYPAPVQGVFNVGVLHTACTGNAGDHAPYAPCSVDQLQNHGYDYWALGHVHGFAVLSEAPHIVYPGNLQGRDPRETGAKGAVLVTVEDGKVASVEHQALDVVRWAAVTIDATPHADRGSFINDVRTRLAEACEEAGDRALAVRIRVTGKTALHHELHLQRTSVMADVEDVSATLGREVWVEKFSVATESPPAPFAVDPTVAGRLAAEIRRLAGDGYLATRIEEKLAEIRTKLPKNAHAEEFLAGMKREMADRAANVALSLIDEANHAAH